MAAIVNDAFLEMFITQKRLGELLGGIPQQTISQYLRGDRALDMDLFVSLCRVLRLDPLEVITAALGATE
ncbi:helix-turn-helix transcriptional regulator [Cryobacterium sp. PH31-O1]|uniref:helix-turn-helix domain-containing protein n=1 Tax=Cryobacterium sp. PH31-O1 TaxID=3046306 RepID=UPI0024B8A0F6|nr:helix-turn-helix transcriptional regulator [Cryobacterium sp. PH31-O1]